MTNELKELIDAMMKILGDKPAYVDWHDRVMKEIKKMESHLWGHADTIAGCPRCDGD